MRILVEMRQCRLISPYSVSLKTTKTLEKYKRQSTEGPDKRKGESKLVEDPGPEKQGLRTKEDGPQPCISRTLKLASEGDCYGLNVYVPPKCIY